MLLKRFLYLITSVTIWRLCRGNCHSVPSDLNTKWREADVLERYGRNYYKSLAVGPEDCSNSRKRFVSIFSHAALVHMSDNITSKDDSIRQAVLITRRQLDKPAEVIAAPFRSAFTFMFSFVDQILTDIQTACPYHIREPDCNDAVLKTIKEKSKVCPGYDLNVELYSAFALLVTSCQFQNLYDDLTRASASGGDNEALDFFMEAASVKFSNILQLFKNLLNGFKHFSFRCNTLMFLPRSE